MGSRRTLRAEELSRDVESLAADDNDLLAAQQLLGNDTGETTQKVALAVNDDLKDTQMVSDSVSSSHAVFFSSAMATMSIRHPVPLRVVVG